MTNCCYMQLQRLESRCSVTFLIACIVAMWLICNEIISILENIQDMGVNIPAFLQPLVKHIRSQVEERINIDEKDEKDSEDE